MKEHEVPCLRQKSISKVRITSTSILHEKIRRTSYKISSFKKNYSSFFYSTIKCYKEQRSPIQGTRIFATQKTINYYPGIKLFSQRASPKVLSFFMRFTTKFEMD